MPPENHQKFLFTFFEMHICQDNILLKKDIKKLSHILLEFYIDEEYQQIQKNIYELLYYTFLKSYGIQEHILL